MTATGRTRGAPIDFAENRAAADRAEAEQRVQAARTVADHSLDVSDCRELLSMLGLHSSDPDAELSRDRRRTRQTW